MCRARLAWNTGRKNDAKKSPSGNHAAKLLSSNVSSTGPYNMVNFGLLAAEIVSLVWSTPANFNGFHVLAALLHSTAVLGVSQTLRRWTEGATYIWRGRHHVGHRPTFLVLQIVCNVSDDLQSLTYHESDVIMKVSSETLHADTV